MDIEQALGWAEYTATRNNDPLEMLRIADVEAFATLAAEVRKLRAIGPPLGDRDYVVEELQAEVRRLREFEEFCVDALSRAEAAEKERDHWKANHADMVYRNKLLHDRPDLGDRAASVQKLLQKRDELRSQLSAAEAKLARAEKVIAFIDDMCQYRAAQQMVAAAVVDVLREYERGEG